MGAWLLSGCVTQRLRDQALESSIYSDERELLANFSSLMMRTMADPAVEPEYWNAVQSVLGKLQKEIDSQKKIPYRVTVIKTGMINAFSLPNGQIFVTTGMLDFLDSEHALAAVLGHEIAHVELSHYANVLDRASFNLPLSQVVTHIFDQAQEYESDDYGIRLAEKAGYSRAGFSHFIQAMRLIDDSSAFLKTHPAWDSRLEKVEKTIGTSSAARISESSEIFKKMKTHTLERQRKYFGHAVEAEEPPRVRFRDASVHSRFEKAVLMILSNLDSQVAIEILQDLKTESSSEQAILRIWMGRAHLMRGRGREALMQFTEAMRLSQDFPSTSWLVLQARWVEEKKSAIKKEWHEKAFSPACQADPECIRLAMRTAKIWWGDEVEGGDYGELERLAKQYRKRMTVEGESAKPSEHQIQSLSQTIPVEIVGNLQKDSDERTRTRSYPAGFRPTPFIQDLSDIEKHLLRTGDSLGYRESGFYLGFESGPVGYGGGLKELLGSGFVTNVPFGLRHYPFEIGFNVLIQPSRSMEFPAGQTHKIATRGFGFSLGWDWTHDRLRPWTHLGLFRESIYQDLDINPNADALTSGWSVALRSGLTYRVWSLSGAQHFLLRLTGGIRQSWFTPVSGSSGRGWSWETHLGLLLFGGVIDPGQDIAQFLKPPPVFF